MQRAVYIWSCAQGPAPSQRLHDLSKTSSSTYGRNKQQLQGQEKVTVLTCRKDNACGALGGTVGWDPRGTGHTERGQAYPDADESLLNTLSSFATRRSRGYRMTTIASAEAAHTVSPWLELVRGHACSVFRMAHVVNK